jgi:energy-coupling factor transporter ATP-binding protein EcfA2
VRVAGQDPIALTPRQMSRTVGFVFQDPETQAVVDVVEDELAFAMENQGLPLSAMQARIEWALGQLNIAHLRCRQLSTLSGGERQRVAIGAVLTLQPQVLVLDEPTSQLDPQAAEELLDTLVRLNHDLGLTIVLSEHRLERVVAHADRILYLPGGGKPAIMGEPSEVLSQVPLVPPVVELARSLGWTPLPLTIDDARTLLQADPQWQEHMRRAPPIPRGFSECVGGGPLQGQESASPLSTDPKGLALELRGVSFAYNGAQALRSADLAVRQGEFVALMGPNGAGKTTLLKHCIGLLQPDSGQVRVTGLDTRQVAVEALSRHVGYVPQNPNALLFADTVAEELAFTRRAQGVPRADEEPLLHTLGLAGMRDRYPRDLSVGERQRVALAAVLVGDPELILLDEPTRGLDYAQKGALISFLRAQKERGRTVIVVTHDVELVAQCAERIVLMEDGRIVLDGPTGQVMSAAVTHAEGWPESLSERFASQISRLFGDPRYLTVEDVMAARESASRRHKHVGQCRVRKRNTQHTTKHDPFSRDTG